jgi:hypothetical protein
MFVSEADAYPISTVKTENPTNPEKTNSASTLSTVLKKIKPRLYGAF